jgi:hypothetical protein
LLFATMLQASRGRRGLSRDRRPRLFGIAVDHHTTERSGCSGLGYGQLAITTLRSRRPRQSVVRTECRGAKAVARSFFAPLFWTSKKVEYGSSMSSMTYDQLFKDIGNTAVEFLSKSKPNLDPGPKSAGVTEKIAHRCCPAPIVPSPLSYRTGRRYHRRPGRL